LISLPISSLSLISLSYLSISIYYDYSLVSWIKKNSGLAAGMAIGIVGDAGVRFLKKISIKICD